MWAFQDEATENTNRFLDQVSETGAVVPSIWTLEVANALLVGQRRGRLGAGEMAKFVALIEGMPIRQDSETGSRALHAIRELAERHSLTAYDAAYLELAMRLGAPLASRDRSLCAAAERVGVEVLPL